MKLNKYFAAALLSVVTLSPLAAQTQEEKPFSAPKAGDFSIGFDATSVINFLGNTLNGTAGQTLEDVTGKPIVLDKSLIKPTASIMGRYMLSSDMAIRFNVGVIADNDNTTAYAADDHALALNSLSEAKVVDSRSILTSGGSLSVGLEYRIGRGRIQGVFSGSALYIYSITSHSYQYGNAMTELNQNPSSAGLDISTHPSVSYFSSLRTLNTRGGATHAGGLVGSAGIEYFVANGVSLGAEVNLVAAYAYKTQSYGDYEGYNVNTKEIETYTNIETPASGSFYLGTDNVGANISVNFYF